MVPIRLVLITSHHACKRRLALHAGDSGLRDHDVELAELGEPVVQRGAQLRGVAHVGLRDDDALGRFSR